MSVTDPDVPDPLNDPRTLQADPGAYGEGQDLASGEDDPNFALHAARDLSQGSYDGYPVQAGPRLAARDRLLGRLGPWTGPDPVRVERPAEV